MNRLIYKLLRLLLRFNVHLYGRGASRDLCRDLEGEFRVDDLRRGICKFCGVAFTYEGEFEQTKCIGCLRHQIGAAR